MTRILQYAGQLVVYAAFGLLIGYLASSPTYNHFPADKAMVKMSFAHGAKRIGECIRRTREELAKLPPNARVPVECPRERHVALIELETDGNLIFRRELPPSGLFKDGAARVYEKFTLEPGRHRLTARLRDSGRTEGFDYETTVDVDLRPTQNLSIDFHADSGDFLFE